MKRNEHTFQFTGDQIAKAAKAECDYHKERLVYWQQEQEKAIGEAKKAGVEIKEYDVTGGKQVNVVIDTSVQMRLSTCAAKIASHRQVADRLQIEAAAYATQPARAYELHPDDVVYFRLAGGARED
jgi:hypothetical protein